MAKVPELKGGQMITIAYIIGILVLLFIVYKILTKIGLVKSAADKKTEAAEIKAVEAVRTSDIFNPYYLQGRTYKSIGTNAANAYADQLHYAMSGFGTDEEAIYATFGKLYNKVNVSEVALAYAVKYERDLQADLLSELNQSEKTILWNIINKLPEK